MESIEMLTKTGRRLESARLETMTSGDLTAGLVLLSECDTIGSSLSQSGNCNAAEPGRYITAPQVSSTGFAMSAGK